MQKPSWLRFFAVLTLMATAHAYWLESSSSAPQVVAARIPASSGVPPASSLPASLSERRVAIETPQFDPFFPPPAPPARAPVELAVAVPPPPAPIPMPYQFMGRIGGAGGQPAVYLARGDEILVAEKGRVLEGVFQVDDIAPDRIVMTHVPTAQKTELPIPRAAEPAPNLSPQ